MLTVMKQPGRAATTRLFGIVALTIVLCATVASLAAATPVDDGSTHGARPPASVMTIAGTERADSAPTLTSCPINKYGYIGYRICEFDYTYIPWNGGYDTWNDSYEWFIVGTDFHIWHIWPNSGGWHSLGGVADSHSPNGAYTYLYSVQNGLKTGVKTWGTDYHLWCRDWPWSSGWHHC